MQFVRLCWTEEVRRLKREVATSGGWTEAREKIVDYYEILVRVGNDTFGAGTHWCEYVDVQEDRMPPDIAVRKLIEESMRVWMDGEVKEHLRFFSESAVFVTPTGSCFRGHGELLQAFEVERAVMPGLRMVPDSTQVILLAEDAAVVLMTGSIEHDGITMAERWTSTQSVSFTKRDGWRIASLQVFHAR